MTWATLAILAAFFQTLRFIFLKKLTDAGLSPFGATYARYFFALPFACVTTILYFYAQEYPLPQFNVSFGLYVTLGASSQIIGTACVMALFKRRNFVVGTVLKKTETLQVAFLGFLILGDNVTAIALSAMFVGLLGVLLLSDQNTKLTVSGFFSISSGLGFLSGFFFALAGVGYRGAGLSLEIETFAAASLTLMISVILQILILHFYLSLFERGSIYAVLVSWRHSMWIGLTSVLGSLCWFSAFILQNAAYVNAVGQVEVIFSLLVSWLFFRERVSLRETVGCLFILVSVLVLI